MDSEAQVTAFLEGIKCPDFYILKPCIIGNPSTTSNLYQAITEIEMLAQQLAIYNPNN